MTLTPETRVVLTEALRPPVGYRVDIAVGTTYSLDLTALLAAPLAFAVADALEDENLDPIRLLDAVRRHADRTTVFCQAGGIHVPAYQRIMTLLEDGVVEVTAPGGGVFHPKIWAIRFVDTTGAFHHRVVVLSRNLTFDRSWDTALVLDESPTGTISAALAARFVRTLPSLAIRPLHKDRREQIVGLATTLESVSLAAPAPFTSGELIPIGLTGKRTWPFPDTGHRLLAISPFLTQGAVRDLAAIAPERTLVSRADSLDALGPAALDVWETHVLQPLVETDDSTLRPTDPTSADDGVREGLGRDGFLESGNGLHAKTFIIDLPGRESVTITGSANLTGAAWGTNVEFDAVLRGPTRSCGVTSTLDGPDEAPGMRQVLDLHVVSEQVDPDGEYETGRWLEEFHQALATSQPMLEVAVVDDDRVTATLTFAAGTSPALTDPAARPGPTRVRLLSLRDATHALDLTDTVRWTIAPQNVTPFVVVETTAGAVSRRCVLKAELRGAVGDRRSDAVMSVLTNQRDVLRYLVFLLGDPSYDSLLAELAGDGATGEAGWGAGSSSAEAEIALFEPLVRAAGRAPDALARVAGLVADLRKLPNAGELVPESFDELWDVVWQAHEELQR